jgi:hypothetical protein
MSCHQRYLCLLLIVLVASVAGCQSDTPAPPAAATYPPAAPDTPVLNPDVPQTPELAVQTVLDGLKASKPVALWDALPATAQQTIDKQLGDAIATVDPEVWQRTVANLKKLVTLLETRKSDFLACALFRTGQIPKVIDLKAAWDPGVQLLKALVNSDVVDQQKMSKFSGRAFFGGVGATVFAEARAVSKTMKPDRLAFLDGIKATVKKTSDSAAQVTLNFADPKAKPMEMRLAIIEGKWTSQQMAFILTFGSGVATAYFEPFHPYHLVEWKSGYLKDMDRLSQIIDKLQAAKSGDEFQNLMFNQVLLFAMQKGGQLRAPRPQPTPTQTLSWDRKANTAMIVVKGLHSFEEPTYEALTKALRAVDLETFRGPKEVEGSTLFFVGPTDNVLDKVVKAIQVGKIADTDKLRDIVKVELPTSLKEPPSTAEAPKAK